MARAEVAEYSVAIPEGLEYALREQFLKHGAQEDGGFGLWAPVYGKNRTTALVVEWVSPRDSDVEYHGNITLSSAYYERVRELARERGLGILIAHSHPGVEGWPVPSSADVRNELNHLARGVLDLTGLPLVGLILAGNGIWGARFYVEGPKGKLHRAEAISVRSVGRFLRANFNPATRPPPKPTLSQTRTRTFWGDVRQADLARLRVGIVGFGSVGSIVAEQLARIGVGELVVIEFDTVEEHNLDRLIHATASDARRRIKKLELAKKWIPRASTAASFHLDAVDGSIVEPESYRRGLDCDVLFSCVDMNWPRQVLNHLSYTCAVPVVDGGVSIRVRRDGSIQHAVARTQTVGPGRACLSCLGMYDAGRVQMERDGTLVDPEYIERLGDSERLAIEQERQNVIPFAVILAGLEVSQFIELVTGMADRGDLGRQQYDYLTGEITIDHSVCLPECEYIRMAGEGSRKLPVLGSDPQRPGRRISKGLRPPHGKKPPV